MRNLTLLACFKF